MMNPVLRREAITSLRGWRNYAVITFYLALTTGCVALFMYFSAYESYDFSFDPYNMVILYGLLCAVQMGLIVLAVPALTAGSISGERERQTLDLLLVTKMSPLSIVVGKLLSSMAFVLLLIVGTLPVFGVVFYFGGVEILDVLQMMGFMLATAFLVGAISVFFSCIYKRTVVSIMLVYIAMGLLCFGTLTFVIGTTAYYGFNYDTVQISIAQIILPLIPNPGVGFFSLIDSQLGTDAVSQISHYAFKMLHSGTLTPGTKVLRWIASNYWLTNIIFNLVVGTLFVGLAARFVRPGRETKRRKKAKKTGTTAEIE